MTAAERDDLILSLEPTVKVVARNWFHKVPRSVTFDEIVSAAWAGAIDAADRFDPARKVKLASFAKWRISGAIGDYLRSLDPVSRDERRKLKANPDVPQPRTFSIQSVYDNGDRRIFDIGDKRSRQAVRRVEAGLDVAKIIRRADVKPRAISILTRHAHGEKMKAIGRSEGIKESRVSQICKATLVKLRAAA